MKEILPERIAKKIAASGHCSRRDAEKLIEQGRVKIEGKLVTTPAIKVTDEIITIDGMAIADPEQPRIFTYYKPVGLVTTHKDEKGRRTVFESLPKNLPRLISIGRLDINSEGLLLLTNSGELARKFELPSSGLRRLYRVRVFGRLPHDEFRKLKNGITIDGVRYESIDVEVEKEGTNSWLQIALKEGKNREIRRVMEYFGLEVSRLIRTQYGPYQLGKLQEGEIKEAKIFKSVFEDSSAEEKASPGQIIVKKGM